MTNFPGSWHSQTKKDCSESQFLQLAAKCTPYMYLLEGRDQAPKNTESKCLRTGRIFESQRHQREI